jgi:hypothetical protein
MRVRSTLMPGQHGIKQLLEQYGEQLYSAYYLNGRAIEAHNNFLLDSFAIAHMGTSSHCDQCTVQSIISLNIYIKGTEECGM